MGAFTGREKDYGRVKVESNVAYIYESTYQRRPVNTPCGNVKEAYWQNGILHIVMTDNRHFTFDKTDCYSNYWYD